MPFSASSSSPADVCVPSQFLPSIPYAVYKMIGNSYDTLTGNSYHQDTDIFHALCGGSKAGLWCHNNCHELSPSHSKSA